MLVGLEASRLQVSWNQLSGSSRIPSEAVNLSPPSSRLLLLPLKEAAFITFLQPDRSCFRPTAANLLVPCCLHE